LHGLTHGVATVGNDFEGARVNDACFPTIRTWIKASREESAA